MVIVGLLFILLGVLAILSGVFLSEVSADNPDAVAWLGIDISPMAFFLIGVASGAAAMAGISILKFGTKRSLAHRRERRELAALNEKLDRVEADRKRDEEH